MGSGCCGGWLRRHGTGCNRRSRNLTIWKSEPACTTGSTTHFVGVTQTSCGRFRCCSAVRRRSAMSRAGAWAANHRKSDRIRSRPRRGPPMRKNAKTWSTTRPRRSREVNRLGDLLNEKMPDFAPSFYEVRKALEDCQTIAQWIKQENGGGGAPAAEGGEAAPAVARRTGGSGGALTREAAYDQLKRVAEMLERMEPHSPVPYLIRRAVELRAIKFRAGRGTNQRRNVLAFLKREIGATEGG